MYVLRQSIMYTEISDSSGYIVRRLSSWKKNSKHLQDADLVSHVCYQGCTNRSWYWIWLSGSHVESYFDLSFFMGSI